MKGQATLEQFLLRRDGQEIAFAHRDEAVAADAFAGLVATLRASFADSGLRAGSCLLLVIPKSIRALAALYAALADGIVVVPVDVDSPMGRLGHILADAEPALAIVDAGLRTRVGGLLDALPLAAFEPLGDGIRLLPSDAAPRPSGELFAGAALDGELTAYIIYTSGSTGVPKGVCVPRAALASFLRAAVARVGYGADTVFLNFFPLHFDPVLMEVLVPWAVGGRVVILDRIRMVNDLVEALHEHEVTDLSATPNLISLLVGRFSSYARRPAPHLRTVWFGGESPNVAHLRAFQQISPQIRLYNGYGPTETVVACSLYEVPDLRELPADWEISIGTPMPGVEYRLVDEAGDDVEGGVVGELLVGGAQLMSGYHGVDPDDAAANGFVEREGRRFFRTGDLVALQDGRYLFVGRAGGLVKVDGYRIHPGEVERALSAVPGIGAAVAFVDERSGALQAVAEAHGVEREAVVRQLEEALPSYMVPRRIDLRSDLPRLSNGKLDLTRIRATAASGR